MRRFVVCLGAAVAAIVSASLADTHPAPEVCAKVTELKGPYFGQKPPGRTPRVFASEVFWRPGRRVTRSAFSPDGTECIFGVPNDNFSRVQLYSMRRNGDLWTEPVVAPFAPPTQSSRQPFFAADGRRLFFSSNRGGTSDIWVVDRTARSWGVPRALPSPINTPDFYEGMYTQATDGTAYFDSDRPGGHGKFDIWRIDPPQAGRPLQVVNLGPTVNSSEDESDPFIAPDGSYLLFNATRGDGCGQSDIYVTFADGKGGWSIPENLNRYIPGVNTADDEYGPTISADGCYLFWVRLHHHPEGGGVYWVENALNRKIVPSKSP